MTRTPVILASAVAALLLAMASCAHAQQVIPRSSCLIGKINAVGMSESECARSNGLFEPAATVTNSTPKCEDGWTLVYAGKPMCARELKEPK